MCMNDLPLLPCRVWLQSRALRGTNGRAGRPSNFPHSPDNSPASSDPWSCTVESLWRPHCLVCSKESAWGCAWCRPSRALRPSILWISMNTRGGILQWNSRARMPTPHRQWGPVFESINSPAQQIRPGLRRTNDRTEQADIVSLSIRSN